jgi:hypothetical protein
VVGVLWAQLWERSIGDVDCSAFTDEQLVVITSALTAGVVGVVTLGLAYITKTVRSWLG